MQPRLLAIHGLGRRSPPLPAARVATSEPSRDDRQARRGNRLRDTQDDPVRLTILAGFLGSGKTTWLRHQLREGIFQNAHVIVNEAADTPVDDALLAPARLTVLSGGCACCTQRDALLHILRQGLDGEAPSHGKPRQQRHIVLETSGLADPGPILAAIDADTVLAHRLVVGEVVVAIDALNGLALLRHEALARRQVAAADALIVTKLDEADPVDAGTLLATLQLLNPRAFLFAATKGVEIPLPPFDAAIPEDLAGATDDQERAPVFAATLVLDDTMDWPAFTVWLSALLHARGDDVLRVKGVVATPAGRLLVQTVRKVIQTPEILPAVPGGNAEGADDMIVVIGRGYKAEHLMRSLRRFAGAGGGRTPTF